MADNAVARDVVASLRRDIARIEGRLAERLLPNGDADALGTHGPRVRSAIVSSGTAAFDAALGGGLPLAALTEIHTRKSFDAGAAAGFALAVACRIAAGCRLPRPLLWIGDRETMREGGVPYLPGVTPLGQAEAGGLLLARPERIADALWIADEAALLKELCAVVLEVRGNPRPLDLKATRRLQLRAREAGRPILLVREGARPEPTAALLRLVVETAPSLLRGTLAGALAGSIGGPAFSVTIDKSQAAPSPRFILDWNPDDRSFRQRLEGARTLVSSPADRSRGATAAGALLAFRAPDAGTTSGTRPHGAEREASRSA